MLYRINFKNFEFTYFSFKVNLNLTRILIISRGV